MTQQGNQREVARQVLRRESRLQLAKIAVRESSLGVDGVRQETQFKNELTGDPLPGNELVRAPELTATAAIEYARPLGSLGTAWARVEYQYRGSLYYTKENDPLLAQDGFGLLNLYLRLDSATRRWYAFASGRNLTHEDYFHQVLFRSSPGYPDTLGIGWRF